MEEGAGGKEKRRKGEAAERRSGGKGWQKRSQRKWKTTKVTVVEKGNDECDSG